MAVKKMQTMRFVNLGIIVVVLGLLFFSFEVILRLYAPFYLTGYIGFYQYDRELGYRLKDGVHAFKTTDHQQEILTNPLGTVNFQKDFHQYQIPIFAVGDSFTQGTGLPADCCYPFQLDLLLNIQDEHYVKKYAVINLGLAAFGGEQNLLALKRYAAKLGPPRFILYLGVTSDYERDLFFKSGYSHKHLVPGSPYWGWSLKPLMWLTNETEVGKRVKFLISSLRRQKIFSNDGKTGTPKGVAELEAPVFEELVKLSKDYRAKLIVSWASPWISDGSYQWLQEFARKHNIGFADWYPAVHSTCQGIPGLPVNNDHSGGHFRTWVNSQIARAYAKQILAQP